MMVAVEDAEKSFETSRVQKYVERALGERAPGSNERRKPMPQPNTTKLQLRETYILYTR